MHRLPARIPGVWLCRPTVKRRPDGSRVAIISSPFEEATNNATALQPVDRQSAASRNQDFAPEPSAELPVEIVSEQLRAVDLGVAANAAGNASANGCGMSRKAYEEQISAQLGFTCEPHYTRRLPVAQELRCLSGSITALAVDLRRGSRTLGTWQTFELQPGNGRWLICPPGVAVGWQVTTPTAELLHRLTERVSPKAWRWLPWDDPLFEFAWPLQPSQCAIRNRHCLEFSAIPRTQLPSLLAPPQESSTKKPAATARYHRTEHKSAPEPTPRTAHPVSKASDVILVIGSSGQLGHDLCRHMQSVGRVVGACRDPRPNSLLPVPVRVDISRPASLRQAIRQAKPGLIINAASLTDVEQAEQKPRMAQMVNATAPAIIAEEAERCGASVIHFCSAMVYSGEGDVPWRESDSPSPINQFARTKLLGTQAILASEAPHLVLRTGWLYASRGENYVRRIVQQATYRETIGLADDYFGTPTSTDWLARTVSRLLSQNSGERNQWMRQHQGLYHVALKGFASRAEVGEQILATCRQFGLPVLTDRINPLSIDRLQQIAQLPRNSRLDSSKFAVHFDIALPRWQDELQQQLIHIAEAHVSEGTAVA